MAPAKAAAAAAAGAANVVGAYAYCALSAAFFAACAAAQLNDPDPLPWVAGYVTGGCALNALFVLHHSAGQHFFDAGGGGGGGRPSTGSAICRRIATVFAAGTALVAGRIGAVGLLPRLDLRQPPRALAWSILEYEEGREIAGLLLLFLHVWKLRGYFCLCGDSGGGGGAANVRAGAEAGVGTTVLMVGIIAFAAYLWVYYQPLMNARYGTEHCDGAFGKDRGGVSLSSEL